MTFKLKTVYRLKATARRRNRADAEYIQKDFATMSQAKEYETELHKSTDIAFLESSITDVNQ